jgi:hypothetical protein
LDPSKRNPTILINNQIINIISLIELLSLCCEGKSDKAEEKCQTELLTLENSYTILKACDYLWPLKRTLLNYVWQCFLDTNNKKIYVEPHEHNVKIIWQVAEMVLDDMKKIVEGMAKQMDTEVYVKYPYKDGVKLRDEALQYMTESVVPFFKYLLKRKDIYIEEDKEYIIEDFTK